MLEPTITPEERTRLRALAQRVAELSATEENDVKRREWYRHNALKAGQSLILVYPEGAWGELLPKTTLQCRNETAREVEYKLLARIFQTDYLRDDSVVEPEFLVPKIIDYKSFVPQRGVHRTTTFCFHTGLVSPVTGWELNPVSGFIPSDWEADRQLGEQQADHSEELLSEVSELSQYTTPTVSFCEKESLEKLTAIQECIGDILNVRLAGVMHCSFHLASTYCTLRGGLMNLLYDLVEQPDLVQRTMERLREFNVDMIKQYEQQNLFTLNNGGYLQSTGGLGFTSELPAAGFDNTHVRAKDIWASCEAQEFSHVSPQMYSEFMGPYEKDLMRPFGLSGYGCCEPLEYKLDELFTFQNLRRISCSPFADIKKFAEKVQDKYILSWKPDPAILSCDFATATLETYLREALRHARGTRMEIILKDTHTCQHQPERFQRWMETARRILNEGAIQ